MEKEKRGMSFELRLMGNALCKQLAIYEQMQNGEIPLLPDTKQSLYTSIIELCSVIIKKLDN